VIRINLLPKRAIKRVEDARKQILSMLLGIVVVLGGLIYFNSYLSGQVQVLEDTRAQRQAELKRYEAIVKRINEIQAKVTQAKKRIEIINNLSSHRSAIIRSLAQVVMAIPQNRVYLRALNHTKETITLDATARDHDSVAEFMDLLKAREDIKTVVLKGATLKTLQTGPTEVVDFGLVCDTVYKPAPPPPQKAKK
jgi:type IV pilus assembly protein PilN